MAEAFAEKMNHFEDMCGMVSELRFETCWTCIHCILDIGAGQYICDADNHALANQQNRGKVHEPTDCPKWVRG